MTDGADTLRAAGKEHTSLRGLWLTFLSPFGLEVAGASGAEWVGIDLQHGDLDVVDVAPLLRASRVPVLARLASHDAAHIARVLDTGVDGVILPAVSSGAQARSLVTASCLPPAGRRSSGICRAGLLRLRGRPLLLPMVETSAGLDAVDEILDTDGVDGIFVGPYDLALSLGERSVLDEPVQAAVDSTISRAQERGRLAGLFAGDNSLAARFSHADLLALDSDAGCLQRGLQSLFGRPTTVDPAADQPDHGQESPRQESP